jgi:uncharacterized protein (DUF58 family)
VKHGDGPLLTRGPIFRLLRHIALYRLTDAGKTLFWITIFAMGTGQATLAMQIYLVFCISFGLAVTSLVGARLARATLEIEASLPARTVAGSRLTLELKVTNQSRHVARDVIISEDRLPRSVALLPAQGSACPRIAPGETWYGSRQLEFLQRGSFLLPGLLQQTVFPWGIWADVVWHQQPRSIRVYPHFTPLQQVTLPPSQHKDSGSSFPINLRGESLEFMGVREYRSTDSVKDLHSRTWARLGRPAVKEFLRECSAHACLLIDTALAERPSLPALEAFEALLSLAAAIADCLLREGFVLGLVLLGSDAHHLRLQSSVTELEEVLDLLASVEPTVRASHAPPGAELGQAMQAMGSTVMLLPGYDAEHAQWLTALRERGLGVRAVVVTSDGKLYPSRGTPELPSDLVVLDSAQVGRGVASL